MIVGAHLIISGLVQGVGFRYFVYRKATSYGLNGYARNLFSGEVEIKVFGDRSKIEILIADVKVGPRSAVVRDVKITWLNQTEPYSTFELY